jgi:hypothetical protein
MKAQEGEVLEFEQKKMKMTWMNGGPGELFGFDLELTCTAIATT